jgi:hypothetical protein
MRSQWPPARTCEQCAAIAPIPEEKPKLDDSLLVTWARLPRTLRKHLPLHSLSGKCGEILTN